MIRGVFGDVDFIHMGNNNVGQRLSFLTCIPSFFCVMVRRLRDNRSNELWRAVVQDFVQPFGRVSRVEGLQKGCKVLVFVAKAGLEESPVRAASRMRTSRFTLTSQVPTI